MLNLNRLQHICYAIALCFLLSSCQADQEATAPQSLNQKQTPGQIQTSTSQEAPLQDNRREEKPVPPPAINLNLSKEILEEIAANSHQEQTSALQEKIENGVVDKRKMKISGGVLIDKDEEDLTKKVDGGEVLLSVPFN